MMAGLAGGFAIIPNLKQIYHQATTSMGAMAVTLFACSNAAGRVIWGGIHDKFGGKRILIANLISQAIVLLLGSYFVANSMVYYFFAIWAGFNYGGVLVLYASEGGAIWGPNKIPKVYGWLFFANVPGSLAPLFAGFMYDQLSSFSVAFAILSVYLILTAVYLIVKYPNNKSRVSVVS